MTDDKKWMVRVEANRVFPGELYQKGIPSEVKRAVDYAIAVGNIKHGREMSLRKGKASILASLRHHLDQYEDGVFIDPDDGQDVMASVAYRACQLIAIRLNSKHKDKGDV